MVCDGRVSWAVHEPPLRVRVLRCDEPPLRVRVLCRYGRVEWGVLTLRSL